MSDLDRTYSWTREDSHRRWQE